MAKEPHLADLFKTGMPVDLEIPTDDPDKPQMISLWMRKPSATQHEEALGKARGKQGRRRALYRDPDSDEYIALAEQMEDLDKDGFIKELMAYEENDLRTQAWNEALYKDNEEDEPKWGKEGQDYLDVLAGLKERHDEIAEHNDALADEDRATMMLKPEEDEEIVRLNAVIDEFGDDRDEVYERLVERKRAELNQKATAELKKILMKKVIDLEVSLVHYQEYRTLLIYFATRHADDHHKLYFRNPDQIWDLPDWVRVKLFDAYDELEQQGAQLKN